VRTVKQLFHIFERDKSTYNLFFLCYYSFS